ncbi:hypothetical protein GCM10029976_094690 [Kribbella albertanoniae]|uniref:Uncharacterized protein n=1 Tax=Kribbella albertanoniae TaxID=1266829 RepID=A0A4R4PNM8_9ACTN|nr:hypothetical protein [Kribbella albertanoniae]TDC23728.1 hypothetical protein E1261_27765 [Kribbella albertanoniae]
MIRAAAYGVPLCVLPSAGWRIWHLGWGPELPAACARMGWIEPYYVASLSVVSLGVALLTIGLVRPWGEVYPRWMPRLGGRRVPIAAAVVPACAGVVFAFGMYGWGGLNQLFGFYQPVVDQSCPAPPTEGRYGWVVIAAYAPLLMCGPLLAVVTHAYYRRRAAEKSTTTGSAW